MGWDIVNNGYSLTLQNSNGYQKTIFKSEIAVVVNSDNSRLHIESSQSPYIELCYWDELTISSLTGADDSIAIGFALLEEYLSSNEA